MTKNKTWKRVAAGVLSLALVAGMMPANVGGFLTGGTGIVASAEPAAPESDADWKEVDSLDALKSYMGVGYSEAYVRLTADISTDASDESKVNVSGNKTLDLNGHTITFNHNYSRFETSSRQTFILTDNSTSGSGSVVNAKNIYAVANVNGTFILEGGTVDSIAANGLNGGVPTTIIKGGTVSTAINPHGFIMGNLTISDGTVNSEVNCYNGTVERAGHRNQPG